MKATVRLFAIALAAVVVCTAAISLYRASYAINEPTLYPAYSSFHGSPIRPCSFLIDHDDSGLCAAWRAADAAEKAARWSWLQMCFSAVGIVGLGLTLWFNGQAWRQARESEEDTNASLRIAERNADTLAKQLEHQIKESYVRLRPYIYLGRTEIKKPNADNSMEGETEFKNFGLSPARRVGVMVSSCGR